MKSMTPNELLASKNYAVIRVDEQGNFRWMTDTYELEGSAISDAHTLSESVSNVSNGGYYEVVVINHMNGDLIECDSDIDTLHARAFRALVRYMFCGLRQLDEQGDTESCMAYALRDVFTFAEGFLASADIDITSLLDGVTAEHHVL